MNTKQFYSRDAAFSASPIPIRGGWISPPPPIPVLHGKRETKMDSDLKMISQQMLKKKMERYLELLFMDLCAKDNGNQHKSFGLYTFIKVCICLGALKESCSYLSKPEIYRFLQYTKHLSAYLSTRLFAAMIFGESVFTEFDNIPRIRRRIFKEIFIKTILTIYTGSIEE